METFDEEALKAAESVANLVIRKQRDYGPKNITNSIVQTEIAVAVRLTDKIARLVNLASSGKEAENESLKDTVDDIIGYGLVLKMYLEGTFTLPLEEVKDDTADEGLDPDIRSLLR